MFSSENTQSGQDEPPTSNTESISISKTVVVTCSSAWFWSLITHSSCSNLRNRRRLEVGMWYSSNDWGYKSATVGASALQSKPPQLCLAGEKLAQRILWS